MEDKDSLGNYRISHSSTGAQHPSQYVQERALELVRATMKISRPQGQEQHEGMIAIRALLQYCRLFLNLNSLGLFRVRLRVISCKIGASNHQTRDA